MRRLPMWLSGKWRYQPWSGLSGTRPASCMGLRSCVTRDTRRGSVSGAAAPIRSCPARMLRSAVMANRAPNRKTRVTWTAEANAGGADCFWSTEKRCVRPGRAMRGARLPRTAGRPFLTHAASFWIGTQEASVMAFSEICARFPARLDTRSLPRSLFPYTSATSTPGSICNWALPRSAKSQAVTVSPPRLA